jgi:hypothetical protein
MLRQHLDKKSLPEIVRVFLASLIADTKDSRHIVVVDFLTGIVNEMICNLPESINVADIEAALDVFLHDGPDETLNISPFVPDVLELWESSGDNVVHEGALAGRIGFCGNTSDIDLMKGAILGE